jgi:hypothetical protein
MNSAQLHVNRLTPFFGLRLVEICRLCQGNRSEKREILMPKRRVNN